MASPLTSPAINSTNWGAAVNTNWNILNSLLLGGGRNLMTNGNFDVWQRNTSFSFTTTTAVYTADRWKASIGTGSATVSQVQTPASLPPNNAVSILRAAATAATSFIQVGQQIEFNSFALARGNTMTVSFWAQSLTSNANSRALTLRYRYATGAPDTSIIFTGTNIDASVTISTTWAQYTAQITLPSTATSFSLEFALGSTLASGDGMNLSQIQLESGSIQTPFQFELFPDLMLKCQRFYEKSYDLFSYPGTVTELGSIRSYAYNASYLNSTDLRYKVTKFVNNSPVLYPVVNLYSSHSGAIGTIYDGQAGVDVVGNLANGGSNGILVLSFAGSWTAGHWMEYHFTAESEF
jgi:hypothetical protein